MDSVTWKYTLVSAVVAIKSTSALSIFLLPKFWQNPEPADLAQLFLYQNLLRDSGQDLPGKGGIAVTGTDAGGGKNDPVRILLPVGMVVGDSLPILPGKAQSSGGEDIAGADPRV